MRHSDLRLTLALFGLLLTVPAAPSDAVAQSPVRLVGDGTGVTSSGPTEQWRLNAYGVLRGGGNWTSPGDGFSGSVDGGVGGGMGLRLEIPIHQYVVIGPMVDFHRMTLSRTVGVGPDHIDALTFGVWSKGRYLFDVSGHPFEVYISVPMGLSLYFSDARGSNTEVGVSVGLLLGAQFFLNDRIGFLLENGFRRDGFRDEGTRFRTIQFVLNAGITVAL